MAPLQLSYEFEAIKHDVSNLFKKFISHESVRFEDFAKEWRETNFTFIFSCTLRSTLKSKKRIIERLLRVGSEYLADEVPFPYRVAAIYLLYSVYFKQPLQDKLKIRMTPLMYKDLIEFQQVLIGHQHLDAAFILEKLKRERAFIFTAFPKHFYFGWHEFMFGTEEMNEYLLPQEVKQYTEDVLSSDFTESLSSIESEYFALKEKLYKDSKPDEKSLLSKMIYFANHKFPEEMSQRMNSYKAKKKSFDPIDKLASLKNTQKPTLSKLHDLSKTTLYSGNTSAESNSNAAPSDSSDSRADRLALLKEKSFKSKVGRTPHKRKDLNKVIDDEEPSKKKCDEPVEEIFYTRGAMLTPRVVRRNKNKVQHHVSIKLNKN